MLIPAREMADDRINSADAKTVPAVKDRLARVCYAVGRLSGLRLCPL